MTTTLRSVAATAPGKVILAGEHAVVHGSRALATVIDLRTTATITELPATAAIVTIRFHTQRSIHTFSYALDALRAAATSYAQQLSSDTASTAQSLPAPSLLDPLQATLSAVARAHSVKREDGSISNLSDDTLPFDTSCLVFSLLFTCMFRARCAIECDVSSELPMSAGLGSSASYCAALAAAFWSLDQPQLHSGNNTTADHLSLDTAVVNAWAYEG